jgi:hypothetical protein
MRYLTAGFLALAALPAMAPTAAADPHPWCLVVQDWGDGWACGFDTFAPVSNRGARRQHRLLRRQSGVSAPGSCQAAAAAAASQLMSRNCDVACFARLGRSVR